MPSGSQPMQFLVTFRTLQAFYAWLAERWELSDQRQLEVQFKNCHKERIFDGIKIRSLKNRELRLFEMKEGEAYMIYSGNDHYLIKRVSYTSQSGATQHTVEIKKPSSVKENNAALSVRQIEDHDRLPAVLKKRR